MDSLSLEYEVLGHRVRFNPPKNGGPSAQMVVDLVNHQVKHLKELRPDLSAHQLAVLVALNMASEKMSLEEEYRVNVEHLHGTALDALTLLEDASPKN